MTAQYRIRSRVQTLVMRVFVAAAWMLFVMGGAVPVLEYSHEGVVWSYGINVTEAAAAEEMLRPQSHTTDGGDTTNITNAYDTDTSSQSATTYGDTVDPELTLYDWSATASTSGTTEILTLEVQYEATVPSGNDEYRIKYSLDQTSGACSVGTGTWSDLVALTAAAAADGTVASTSLSTSQDLSQVCVAVESSKNQGADTGTIYLEDVRVVREYTPAITLSGSIFENDGQTPLGRVATVTAAVGAPDGATLYSTTTDSAGNFSLSGINRPTLSDAATTSITDTGYHRGGVYAEGKYVIIGSFYDDRVQYSYDGLSWFDGTMSYATYYNFQDVAYGLGRFVAVADGKGSGDERRIAYSEDGITWHDVDQLNTAGLKSIVYGNEMFVATGNGVLAYSYDGLNWSTSTQPANSTSWESVTYGNGRFVAITDDIDYPFIYSDDGVVWTEVNETSFNRARDITYGDGVFLASPVWSSQSFATSSDGINWSMSSSDLIRDAVDGDAHVSYGDGVFAAVIRNCINGNACLAISDDLGATWSTSTDLLSATSSKEVFFGNGRFYVMDDDRSNGFITYVDAGFGEDTPITLYIDEDSTTSSSTATTLTYGINSNSGTTTIYADLVADTFILKKPRIGSSSNEINFATADLYDASDDSDILFTATSSTTTVNADLLIDSSTSLYAPPHLVVDGDFIQNGTFYAEKGEVIAASTAYDMSSAQLEYVSGTHGASPQDIHFTENGTKLYVVYGHESLVRYYELSVPWDVSSASLVSSTSTANQGSGPRGVRFSLSGDKMYVIDTNAVAVSEYDLSTAWDVSSAAYTHATSVSQSVNPRSLEFNEDGTTMTAMRDNGTFYEYSLSTPWDVSTTQYVGSFFVAPGGGTHVSPDGIWLIVSGGGSLSGGAAMDVYKLTTPYDFSVRELVSETVLPGVHQINTGVALDASGSRLYTIGDNQDRIYQYKLDQPQTFSGTFSATSSLYDFTVGDTAVVSPELVAVAGNYTNNGSAAGPQAGLVQLTGSSTLSGSGNFGRVSVAGAATTTESALTFTSLTVESGGSFTAPASGELTITGDLDVSAGTFDINSATTTFGGQGTYGLDVQQVGSIDLSAQNTSPSGVAFSDDGMIMVTQRLLFGGGVWSYQLSEPWNITTATYTGDFLQPSNPGRSMQFVQDGQQLILFGAVVQSYALSTPWDISTASFVASTTFDNSSHRGGYMKSDGTKFFMVERTPSIVYEYNLATPWDITTATEGDTFYPDEGDARGVQFTPDGKTFFVFSLTEEGMYEVSTPWDITTATAVEKSSVGLSEVGMYGDNGRYLYSYNNDDDILYQYDVVAEIATTTGSHALANVVFAASGTTVFTGNASTSGFTIGTTATVTAPNVLTVAGDYTNNGVFTASTSEVIFSGTTQQAATGTMTGTSEFYDLTISNISQDGSTTQSVIFGNDVTATGTMTMLASTSAAFTAGATSTFTNIDWQGADGSPVWLRSTATGTEWYLDVSGSQLTVSYIDVQDSDATPTAGGITAVTSTDSGNNTNWNFGGASVSEWNATNWTLYDTITIDSTQVDDDLTDFPVYVDLADLSATFWSTTPSGSTTVGTDIRITTDSETPTELPRELVFASSTAQTGELHFKADSISSTTDTVFRVYYNGTTTGDYAANVTYGAENVWTNEYVGVWHLQESPETGDFDVFDSTANGYHASSSGVMTSTDLVSGKVGQGIDFDGTDDYLFCGFDVAPDLSNPFSMSAWAQFDTANDFEAAVAFYNSPTEFVGPGTYDTGKFWIVTRGETDPPGSDLGTGYHYLNSVYNGTSFDNYLDGSLDFTRTPSGSNWQNSTDCYIGWDGWTSNETLDGVLDEIRIASSSRSAAWVSAEYTNQATTTDFYTVNADIPASTWNATDWTLYDTITIDAANIDSTLTDFPVYVDLADLSATFWSTTDTSATYVGTDIRVTNSANQELPRELVFASSTAQTGELHFKADSISSSADTEFRIWYNGNTAGDYATDATYGAENVWSNGYEAVYHLDQDPGVAGDGEITDSTGNGNDGSDRGAMTSADKVTGKTGYALDFDGGDDTIDLTDIDYSSSPLTMSAWFKTNTAADQRILSKFSVAQNQTWIMVVSGGSTEAGIYDGSGWQQSDNSSANFIDDNWHYLVGSIDGSNITNYTDAVAATSGTHDDGFPTNDNVWTIGSRNDTAEYFDGLIDEVRIASSTRSAAWVSAEYTNQSTTTDFYTVDFMSINGSSTIANHTATQVENAFDFQNKTNEPLFAFSLTPNSGTATVTEAVFELRGTQSINAGDFSNVRLYRDTDSDAAYDASDIQIGGSGVMSLAGQFGTITFATDWLATTSEDYVLIADWNAPARGSFMTINLRADDLSVSDDNGAHTVYGSVDSVQHARNNRGGGGGSTSRVGTAASVGDGEVVGGEGDAGERIGDDPDFYWPTAHSGEWSDGANAYDQTDGTYATDGAGAAAAFSSFNDSVPGDDVIEGIEVKLEASEPDNSGDISVQLSWDGGTSWTSAKTTPTLSGTDMVVSLGGPSDTWGRTWSAGEFNNNTFRVRLTGFGGSFTVRVDALQVRVYHQATGGSPGGGGRL